MYRQKRAWKVRILQWGYGALFGGAVAHGLAPAAATASSDALRLRALAVSSACKRMMRSGSKGVGLKV